VPPSDRDLALKGIRDEVDRGSEQEEAAEQQPACAHLP
jgi:hypothetical protein